MKILFDHCVPARAAKLLAPHQIFITVKLGWEELENGDLLFAAAGSFDVLLTIDKKMRFERNLKQLPLPIVILDVPTSALKSFVPFQPSMDHLLQTPLDKIIYFIHRDGTVTRYE